MSWLKHRVRYKTKYSSNNFYLYGKLYSVGDITFFEHVLLNNKDRHRMRERNLRDDMRVSHLPTLKICHFAGQKQQYICLLLRQLYLSSTSDMIKQDSASMEYKVLNAEAPNYLTEQFTRVLELGKFTRTSKDKD